MLYRSILVSGADVINIMDLLTEKGSSSQDFFQKTSVLYEKLRKITKNDKIIDIFELDCSENHEKCSLQKSKLGFSHGVILSF